MPLLLRRGGGGVWLPGFPMAGGGVATRTHDSDASQKVFGRGLRGAGEGTPLLSLKNFSEKYPSSPCVPRKHMKLIGFFRTAIRVAPERREWWPRWFPHLRYPPFRMHPRLRRRTPVYRLFFGPLQDSTDILFQFLSALLESRQEVPSMPSTLVILLMALRAGTHLLQGLGDRYCRRPLVYPHAIHFDDPFDRL